MEPAVHDLASGERLVFQNVVSSRARFHYSRLVEHLDRFTSRVRAYGGEPKGPFFYSLNNVPMDELVDIEMFLPIRQGSFAGGEGLLFHSYFEVSPLLRSVVKGDFEKQTEVVYAQLLATLEANEFEINTPFYHVVPKDVSPRVLVYVGYVLADTEKRSTATFTE